MGSRIYIAVAISLMVHGAAYAAFRIVKVRQKQRKRERDVYAERQKPKPKKKVKIKPVKTEPREPSRQPPRADNVPSRTARNRAPRKVTPRPPQAPHPSEKPKVVDLTARPVGGLSPDSFGDGGDGPAMPGGNTTLADPNLPRPRKIPRRAWSAPPPRPVVEPPRPRPRPRPRARKVVKVKTLPRPVRVPRLAYPERARRRGIEGTVKLEVTVGKDGRVIKVKLIKGVGYGLDQVAVRALKKARFKPAVGSDGKPMVYTIRYRYTFRLER